jgi:hypothetical protein
MTRSPAIRLNLLLACAFAVCCVVLFAWSASSHAQGNSGVDQYLENNPDGKGGSSGGSNGGSGGSKSGGSNSGGSSSGSGSDAGSGSGTSRADDSKARKKKREKQKDKKDKRDHSAAAGSRNGSPPTSGQPASQTFNTPAKDNGGSSAIVWVIAILLLGPAAVLAWLYLGRRKAARRGPSDQPMT